MLYRRDGTQLDTTKFTRFDVREADRGCKSELFRNGNTLLKMYNIDSANRYRISTKLFELLRKLNDKNVVKLREYFFGLNSSIYKLFSIDAYTMELIKRRQGKLIDADRKEILEIIESLDETVKRLSDARIVFEDMKRPHLIPTDNGITIIDPDMFFRTLLLSKDYVYDLNKAEILIALNSLLYSEFRSECLTMDPIFFQNKSNETIYEIVESQLQEDTIRENQIQKKKKRS